MLAVELHFADLLQFELIIFFLRSYAFCEMFHKSENCNISLFGTIFINVFCNALSPKFIKMIVVNIFHNSKKILLLNIQPTF